MKKKIIILIGGAKYNRGSEAMVRGLIRTLRMTGLPLEIVVSSKDDLTGKDINIQGADRYIRRFDYNRNNKLIRYPIGVLRYILHLKQFTNYLNHGKLLKECKTADMVIVIGGDNYDNAYHAFDDMHSLNLTLRKTVPGKLLMLNCSFNPEEFSDKITDDLKLFDLVTVRESLTYQAVKDKLPSNQLLYLPDIAFAMLPQEVPLPDCFHAGPVVGINLSPLILRETYTDGKEEIINSYQKIIELITSQGMQVLLIPHVMNQTDSTVLTTLFHMNEANNNVYLLNGEIYNAAELKYIISQCAFFMGARTHSTIAAYGSEVPTFVLGYSVKSKGIATDLFGTYNEYVVPVHTITDSEQLTQAFLHAFKQRDNTNLILKQRMPQYLQTVLEYSNLFKKLLDEDNKC